MSLVVYLRPHPTKSRLMTSISRKLRGVDCICIHMYPPLVTHRQVLPGSVPLPVGARLFVALNSSCWPKPSLVAVHHITSVHHLEKPSTCISEKRSLCRVDVVIYVASADHTIKPIGHLPNTSPPVRTWPTKRYSRMLYGLFSFSAHIYPVRIWQVSWTT